MNQSVDKGQDVDASVEVLSVKTMDVFRRSPGLFLAVQAMTTARWALVIPIIILLGSRHWVDVLAAVFLSLFAHYFDFADGFYARKWKMVSELGRFYDPMADKLFYLTSLIALHKYLRLQLIIVIVVVELLLFAHRVYVMARAKKSDVSANNAGKWKAVFQCAVITILLIGQALELESVALGSVTLLVVDWLVHPLLYASLGLACVSLAVHLHRHGIVRLH